MFNAPDHKPTFGFALMVALCLHDSPTTAQVFTDATQTAGINLVHDNTAAFHSEFISIGAGGAVADYDFDGYPDLYLLGGHNQHNRLYRNTGSGRFIDTTVEAQAGLFNIMSSGPVFADVDGDFDLDLLVFSVNQEGQTISTGDSIENRPRLFINNGNGSFTDQSNSSGFYSGMASISGSLADLDKDGDLDLFMTHWDANDTVSKQLFWNNNGQGVFTDVTIDYLGLVQNANFERWTFTPNITDINQDGWLDVLLTSDFHTTRILYSNGISNNQLTFSAFQPAIMDDENGMGAAVADYDNDGDLDWFVTSIWDPDGTPNGNWGTSGNRLYRNTGLGVFEDATDQAGVRQGYWGWGACFADFNNDGHLDIYHENGFDTPILAKEFHRDPAILFMANGDGTFTETAKSQGLVHTKQGRGVSCVDYDLDGDIDIVVMPNNGAYKLYQNTSPATNNYLSLKLFDTGPNPYAINAKAAVTTIESTQTRELTAGNNFVSNNPMTLHYGLAGHGQVNQINITWPDSQQQTINTNIAINQITSISRFCHTRFMTTVKDSLPAATALTLYVHDLQGQAMAGVAVTMNIVQGPHQGLTQQLLTDSAGRVSFTVNGVQMGTDRIRFDFDVATESQLCRSLIQWSPDLIFADSFGF